MALDLQRVFAIAGSSQNEEVFKQALEWAYLTNAELEIATPRALKETSSTDLLVLPHPATGTELKRTLLDVRCPVLLARKSPASGRVVAASDLSDPKFPALESAWELAQRCHYQLTTIHCAPGPVDPLLISPISGFDLGSPLPARDENTPRKMLARAQSRLHMSDAVRMIVARPPVTQAILDVAAEVHAQLLVIGRHQRPRWLRWLWGGTSLSIIRRAPCSVLIVPLGAQS